VKAELSTIEQAYQGTLLMDRDFVIPAIENQPDNRPYNVVHIATHGTFANALGTRSPRSPA